MTRFKQNTKVEAPSVCMFLYPGEEVLHLDVDPGHVLLPAAQAPAHHASQHPAETPQLEK